MTSLPIGIFKHSAHVVHFLQKIFIVKLKFLHVIYESFDCDLTQGFFFIHDFNKKE